MGVVYYLSHAGLYELAGKTARKISKEISEEKVVCVLCGQEFLWTDLVTKCPNAATNSHTLRYK